MQWDGYDSLAAEKECLQSQEAGCAETLTAATRAKDPVPLSKRDGRHPKFGSHAFFVAEYVLMSGFELANCQAKAGGATEGTDQ